MVFLPLAVNILPVPSSDPASAGPPSPEGEGLGAVELETCRSGTQVGGGGMPPALRIQVRLPLCSEPGGPLRWWFTASGKKTNVAAPHQSKIKDFCQLPPRGKLSLNAPLSRTAFLRQWREKNLPPGGRWLAAGETDEERRNLPKRMHQNKTNPQTKTTQLGSPSGRAGGVPPLSITSLPPWQ